MIYSNTEKMKVVLKDKNTFICGTSNSSHRKKDGFLILTNVTIYRNNVLIESWKELEINNSDISYLGKASNIVVNNKKEIYEIQEENQKGNNINRLY